MGHEGEEDAYDDNEDQSFDEEVEGEPYGEWVWDSEAGEWNWIYYDYHSSADEETEVEYDEAAEAEETDDEDSEEATDDPRSATHQTLIVYDWDDTFLPTTFLKPYRADGPTSDLQLELEALEEQIVYLLQKSMRCGVVKIVTNGGSTWVARSGKKFMPTVYQFLVDHEIEVISARAQYKDQYPDDKWEWKNNVFDDEVRSFLYYRDCPSDQFTFLSVGDAQYERYAAQNLNGIIPQDGIRILTLKREPDVAETQSQVEEMYTIIESVLQHDGYGDFSLDFD